MALKLCGDCSLSLPLSEFYLDRGQPRPRCKKCFDKGRGRQTKRNYAPPVEEKITPVEQHRLKVRNAELQAQVNDLVQTASHNDEVSQMVREVSAMPKVPGIRPRERKSGLGEATPLILASDWHVEEPVYPEQVAGRNRYDLAISKRRMERFFEATKWVINHQRQVFKVRDLCMWLGGDLLTSYLHEDNTESNLLSPVETIAYLTSSITDGIDFLLKDAELERLVIPCNDGNHGRLTKKVHSATRVQNSIEWLLYYQLNNHYRHEKRVEFILPTSAFTFFEIYDRTVRFTHGDRVKYGGGVGGIMIPLLKALSRWDTVRHADLTACGHFHQRICLPNMMVNGSLIGFNSYAADIGAPFEPPVQSCRILEPKRFIGADIPLWVADRGDDGASK